MISTAKPHLVRIRITDVEAGFIARMAEKCALGGSRFRVENGTMSPETNYQDQLKGLTGEFALSKYLSGSAHGFKLWRWLRNRNPKVGDGGMDYPGLNVDIKATGARKGRALGEYTLVVRPKDRHEGWVYILGIVAADFRSIALVGWAPTEALPAQVETEGDFRGAFILPADRLFPLMPLRWWK